MDIEKERELFEKFYLKEFGDDYTCPYAQLDKRGDEYIDFHAQDTWKAWLASQNREGYVLVPKHELKIILSCVSPDDMNLYEGVYEANEIIEKSMIGACGD